ncbi:MAG: hypothetical protein E6G44_06855 [Actinobacteria bacterium]|nr:MAG: hypothetical protein E6G44_06855 [Actinomycetota bacterium]
MRCEDVRQQLPDYALGTLSDTEAAAVRRHLRGCGSCRADAAELDQGVALFAQAAHAADPPLELKDRVLSVLQEEWEEPPVSKRARPRWHVGWQAIAAVLIVLAGVATWAGMAQSNAERFHSDAASYRRVLASLGGKDFRAGVIRPESGVNMHGSAVMYDSDHGQSWVMILARAPGFSQPVTVTLRSATGRSIQIPFPLKFDPKGEGWTGMVTDTDLTPFDTAVFTSPDGRVLAQGRIQAE